MVRRTWGVPVNPGCAVAIGQISTPAYTAAAVEVREGFVVNFPVFAPLSRARSPEGADGAWGCARGPRVSHSAGRSYVEARTEAGQPTKPGTTRPDS